MEGGDALMHLGRYAEGVLELRIAEKVAPELRPQIDAELSSYGIR
jgi:hypothetical protein